MHLLPPFLTLSVPSPTSPQKREREGEREGIDFFLLKIFFREKVNIYVDIFSFTAQSYLIFDTSTFQFQIFLAFSLILLTILLIDRFCKHICKEVPQVFETREDQFVETWVSERKPIEKLVSSFIELSLSNSRCYLTNMFDFLVN